jgi:hypothetical protein
MTRKSKTDPKAKGAVQLEEDALDDVGGGALALATGGTAPPIGPPTGTTGIVQKVGGGT